MSVEAKLLDAIKDIDARVTAFAGSSSGGSSSGAGDSGSSGSSDNGSSGGGGDSGSVSTTNPFKGKWISILGDDASAYTGWTTSSDEASEKSFTAQSMWWHKLLTKLGAKLCVNYSYKGCDLDSVLATDTLCLHREDGKAYKNLDGTTETASSEVKPDVVLIFLGMTDFYNNKEYKEWTDVQYSSSNYKNVNTE